MLISNPADLAKRLRPILKDQVVIRYSVQYRGSLFFAAQLSLLFPWGDHDHFVETVVGVSISPHTNSVDVNSSFSIADLDKHPSAIEQMCQRWSERPFDDWMHNEPFMGAYGIFLQGQAHTSVKWEASRPHWRLLTGVVVAELEKFRLGKLNNTEEEAALQGVVLMQRRFEAFAAKTELAWAARELI